MITIHVNPNARAKNTICINTVLDKLCTILLFTAVICFGFIIIGYLGLFVGDIIFGMKPEYNIFTKNGIANVVISGAVCIAMLYVCLVCCSGNNNIAMHGNSKCPTKFKLVYLNKIYLR